jgi:hypothetical protein
VCFDTERLETLRDDGSGTLLAEAELGMPVDVPPPVDPVTI